MVGETSPYRCTTHLLAHLLREIESSLRQVLLPYDYSRPAACPRCSHQPEESGHKKQIDAIADKYSLDTITRTQWTNLAIGSKEQEQGFAAFAHRDTLTVPRPFDDAYMQMIATFEQVL